MLRLFQLRDDSGTEMLINLDHITAVNMPNPLMAKGGQLTVATITAGPVTFNMTIDIARKIVEYLREDIINTPEKEMQLKRYRDMQNVPNDFGSKR